MKALSILTAVILLSAGAWSQPGSVESQPAAQADGGKALFNGKDLTGWTRFVDPGAKGADPDEIWKVKDGVIICRGDVNGYLATEEDIEEGYVLTVEWRWGDAVKHGRNSGVIVHVQQPDVIWPKGIEAQLMHGRAGDFWLIGGATLDVDDARRDPRSKSHVFRMKDEIEKPLGEWNRYEITCRDGGVRLVINGQLVNEGKNASLRKGRIVLQSEGAEIHFRNVVLKRDAAKDRAPR